MFEWMGKKTDHELREGIGIGDSGINGGAVLFRTVYTNNFAPPQAQ